MLMWLENYETIRCDRFEGAEFCDFKCYCFGNPKILGKCLGEVCVDSTSPFLVQSFWGSVKVTEDCGLRALVMST